MQKAKAVKMWAVQFDQADKRKREGWDFINGMVFTDKKVAIAHMNKERERPDVTDWKYRVIPVLVTPVEKKPKRRKAVRM